jgi:hypothetical protein
MASYLSATIHQIQYAGQRRPLSLPQIDQLIESRQLFKRMSDAASANESAQRQGCDTGCSGSHKSRPIVYPINGQARIVTTTDGGSTEFTICLQIYCYGVWATVVCYEYRRGHGRRYIYYAHGAISAFNMDLPPNVMAEMAGEDFQRNWQAYQGEFLRGMAPRRH